MARADIRVGRDGVIDETALPERAVTIIEIRKARAGTYANREITLMYWEIGHYINSVLLGGERAEYGKRILATLSGQLEGDKGTVNFTPFLEKV